MPLNVIWCFCFTDFNILSLICTFGYLIIICCKKVLSWSDPFEINSSCTCRFMDFLKCGEFAAVVHWIGLIYSSLSSGMSLSQMFGLIMVSKRSYVSEMFFLDSSFFTIRVWKYDHIIMFKFRYSFLYLIELMQAFNIFNVY